MATRLPASQRTREELTALIEGRLSKVSAKDELVKLATRLIVEEALEGEAGDAVGRDYYEHGAQPGQGYRNGYLVRRLRPQKPLTRRRPWDFREGYPLDDQRDCQIFPCESRLSQSCSSFNQRALDLMPLLAST
jgi:hypothetical protein